MHRPSFSQRLPQDRLECRRLAHEAEIVRVRTIRGALGMPSVSGPGLRGALSHVKPFLTDLGWNGTIPSDNEPGAFDFVMVATGRAAAPAGADNPPTNIYA